MRRLFIVGHPGLYSGSATELHHQIILWNRSFPEIELNIIPVMTGYKNEPLYDKCLKMGVKYHECRDYSAITKDDAVINFCSRVFMSDLEKINRHTKRVAFSNCMTFLWKEEKEVADKGLISHFLYQRDGVRKDHQRQLQALGSKAEFIHFNPYFHAESLEFSVKDQPYTQIGRISRADSDKFSKDTLHIYEYLVSPKVKRAHFLGFDEKSEAKIGKPYNWITTYRDQRQLSVEDFYDTVDFIVQPTDTTENWPRIFFESAISGKPLVVDNRGGWRTMIQHGVNGFLCDTPRDFVYWGSRLAYEYDLRIKIAENARQRALELSSLEVSEASWRKVFDSLFN